MIKQLVCIACPRGCRLTVRIEDTENPPSAKNVEVSGNSCPKGIVYGRQEVICPMRTLTTTLPYTAKNMKNTVMRLPVKTLTEIPLRDIIITMQKIRAIRITKPVNCGDIIAVLKGEDGANISVSACASTEDFV